MWNAVQTRTANQWARTQCTFTNEDALFTLEEIPDGSPIGELEKIQSILVELNDENYEASKDLIINSTLSSTLEGLQDIIHTLFVINIARHEKNRIFANLIDDLINHSKVNELYGEIPYFAESNIYFALKNGADPLVYELLERKIISRESFTREASFIGLNVNIRNLSYAHRFAYEYCTIRSITKQIKYLPGDNCIKEEITDDINKFYQYRRECVNPTRIAKILRNDDIDSLQEFISEIINFDYNATIENSIFEVNPGLKGDVSLLNYSAIYGSCKCFKHLILNGSNLNDKTVHYAVAGGNLEIIRYLEQNNQDFSKCHRIAAKYFQEEVLAWILDNYSTEIKDRDIYIKSENAFLLRYAAAKNMSILFDDIVNIQNITIFRYFLDINQYLLNTIKYSVLNKACINRNLQKMKMILNDPNSQVNPSYGAAYNSYKREAPFVLETAIVRCYKEIVKFLLETKGIEYGNSSIMRLILETMK